MYQKVTHAHVYFIHQTIFLNTYFEMHNIKLLQLNKHNNKMYIL